jgi:hypothetical protein
MTSEMFSINAMQQPEMTTYKKVLFSNVIAENKPIKNSIKDKNAEVEKILEICSIASSLLVNERISISPPYLTTCAVK